MFPSYRLQFTFIVICGFNLSSTLIKFCVLFGQSDSVIRTLPCFICVMSEEICFDFRFSMCSLLCSYMNLFIFRHLVLVYFFISFLSSCRPQRIAKGIYMVSDHFNILMLMNPVSLLLLPCVDTWMLINIGGVKDDVTHLKRAT